MPHTPGAAAATISGVPTPVQLVRNRAFPFLSENLPYGGVDICATARQRASSPILRRVLREKVINNLQEKGLFGQTPVLPLGRVASPRHIAPSSTKSLPH